jgi:hypothetical protein
VGNVARSSPRLWKDLLRCDIAAGRILPETIKFFEALDDDALPTFRDHGFHEKLVPTLLAPPFAGNDHFWPQVKGATEKGSQGKRLG